MSHHRNKRSGRSPSDDGSDSRAEASVGQPGRVAGDDLIRMRASELHLQRGDEPGDNLGDWLRAEREYRGHDHTEAVSDHALAGPGAE